MKKLFRFLPKRGKHERGGTAITVLVIAFFVALNLILVHLNGIYQWFYEIRDKQYYTLNGSTDAYFEEINPESTPVNFYFCMSKEALNDNYTFGRIYDTVRQFDERYDFFSVRHLDVYYDYTFIRNELGVEEEITDNSVILHSPGIGYVVRSLSTFYIYDAEDASNDEMIFNGEEIVATLVLRVLRKDYPRVYFTIGHGEVSTQSMQSLFYTAGYDVYTADLSRHDVEEECEIIVISSPLYDFEEFKDGSESEITRLRAFIERGGTLVVLRSPRAGELPRLDAFLAEYGISVEVGSYLKDGKMSIGSNSSAILLHYASSDEADAVKGRASAAEGVGDIACSTVTALSLKEGEGYTVSPLLSTYDSASLYRDGQRISDAPADGYTVAALSKTASGGRVLAMGSTGIADAALLDMGSYGNESFLYSFLEYTGSTDATPIGCGVVVLNTFPLSELSGNAATLYFTVLTIVIPLAIAVIGFLLLYRRRVR